MGTLPVLAGEWAPCRKTAAIVRSGTRSGGCTTTDVETVTQDQGGCRFPGVCVFYEGW